jgi:serine/threonine protein kinase
MYNGRVLISTLMLAPNTILQDRYRIGSQLGQGGMGAVYEAVDLRLDTTVALKETLFTDEKLRRQFEREARLLARLHHPALPRVSDHFAENDGEFLVMQYIAGDDLAEMINLRRAPFPLEQVLLWADQLLDALDYLHTQDPQIIHRDIKPQNLKLSGRGQIVLLDFGLAKGQIGEVSRVSTASIFGYTPNYAPLEQIQGLGTDARSDIYALAATLYHFLTNVKPADALTRAAAIVNGQTDPLQPANEVNPAVGPHVALVLQKALSQNREQRYATAAAMRTALHTSSEVTVGGRDEAATVLFAPPSNAATKIVNPSPTVGAVAPPSSESTLVHQSKAPARGRGIPWGVAAVVLILLLGVGTAGYFFVSSRNSTSVITSPTPAESPAKTNQQQPVPADSAPATAATNPATPEKPKAAEPSKETRKKESNNSTEAKNEAARAEAERRKQEEADRKEAADAAAAAEKAEQEREKQRNKRAEADDSDEPGYIEVPNPGGHGTRRVPTVRTRTLPEGTKVMITPNHTRIVTRPDGTTKVIPPPVPPRRRKP